MYVCIYIRRTFKKEFVLASSPEGGADGVVVVAPAEDVNTGEVLFFFPRRDAHAGVFALDMDMFALYKGVFKL